MNERNIVRQQIVMDMLNKIGVDQFKLEVMGNNFEHYKIDLLFYNASHDQIFMFLSKFDILTAKNINYPKNRLVRESSIYFY